MYPECHARIKEIAVVREWCRKQRNTRVSKKIPKNQR